VQGLALDSGNPCQNDTVEVNCNGEEKEPSGPYHLKLIHYRMKLSDRALRRHHFEVRGAISIYPSHDIFSFIVGAGLPAKRAVR